MKDSQSLKKKQRKFIKKTASSVLPQNNTQDPSKIKAKLLTVFAKKPRVIEKKPQVKLTKYETDIVLLLIPLALFLVFLILTAVNEYYMNEISKAQLTAFPLNTQINPYPLVEDMPLLSLSAKSAIIMDADSQIILFSKNPELRFSMASTTKIMTALTALDYYKNDSVLTVMTPHVDGTTLGLQLGDTFYFEDLLYAMMLPSANDAAVAIADNFPGGSVAFVAKMNEKAQQLHLLNTHFADPSGLNDDGDYTTVTDMARLASTAIQSREFAKVTGTKQKLIYNVSQSKQYALTNLNRLLGTGGVTGIKTGTTEGAGEVLVTSSVAGGHTFIIVVMNSTDRFADTGVLLNFIAQSVQFITPPVPHR